MVAKARIIHVLWSANAGPMAAYYNSSLAFAHAQAMAGVEVAACELREILPDVIREDLAIEDEFEDDDTPELVDVQIEDLDDAEITELHSGRGRGPTASPATVPSEEALAPDDDLAVAHQADAGAPAAAPGDDAAAPDAGGDDEEPR